MSKDKANKRNQTNVNKASAPVITPETSVDDAVKALEQIVESKETPVEEDKKETPVVEEEKKEEAAPVVEEAQVVEEEKKEEAVLEDKKPKIELSEATKSMAVINTLVARNAGLKIVGSDSKTGTSFFSGKKRLCKLLKTKRGVTLEINVKLSKETAGIAGMESISAVLATKKHLGTMKHLYRANDAKQIAAIMKEAIVIFKAELEAEKAANSDPVTEAAAGK